MKYNLIVNVQTFQKRIEKGEGNMELMTIGRNFYPGRKVLIYCNLHEDFNKYIENKDRLKLIFVKKGNGIININSNREILSSPCVLCLNEEDNFKLEQNKGLEASSLYFHPAVLNAALNYDNLRNCRGLTITEIQDHSILLPFITRNEAYYGCLSIDFLLVQAAERLIGLINHELNDQDNDYWPCKTRSNLYKLLIEIQTLFYNPVYDISNKIDLKTSEANEIILYLHNNFHKKITIQCITKDLHINRNTLREHFYNATGSSIIAYLNKLRVQKAAILLKDTDLLIAEVCEKVGFYDGTNFGRVFKRYQGCSPSEYRSKWKAKNVAVLKKKNE